MKKIIIIIALIATIPVSFLAGWQMNERTNQNKLNSSFQPAENLVKEITEGSVTSKSYDSLSKTYKQTEDSRKFEETIKPLKNSTIVSSNRYVGDLDNQTIFEIMKDDKKYSVVIGTTEEDGKWAVSSLVVTTDEQ
jgi:hypothetical protein